MLLLQEVEDWHLELCEREPPGIADKVTEAIEALVAGRRMDHIKGWTLHNSGTQTDARRHPLPDPVRLRAKRQALLVAGDKAGNWRALVRHEDPDRRASLRANGSETGVANEREEADGPTVVAVKRDAVASGAMAQERLEADKKRTIAEVRAHSLAEIRREQSTTQSELAKIMHVSQGRVSQIESGRLANSELGTLRSYVEATGGSLRIVADFGDGELTIID